MSHQRLLPLIGRSWTVIAAALVGTVILTATAAMAASPKAVPQTRPGVARPPALRPRCFDLAVTGISFKLQVTQLGAPLIEHPTDRVQVSVVIVNAGTAPVPASFAMPSFHLFRNDQLVVGSVLPETLRPAGSTYTFPKIDTFPHAAPVVYKASIDNLAGECLSDNNVRSLPVDESKLHGTGAAGQPSPSLDLAVSIFSCDKRWEMQAGQMQATFHLAAEVSNKSGAYPTAPSHLTFFSESWTGAIGLSLPLSQLPGPYEKRVFTVKPLAQNIKAGQARIRAKIQVAPGEVNQDNNVSSNSCVIDNAPTPPAGEILIMELPPFRMVGNQLLAYPRIVSRQQAALQGLRLILQKDGVQKRQWTSLALPPRGTVEQQYTENIPNPPVIFGVYKYRLVLTTDQNAPEPPASSILATDERKLSWAQMGQGALQESLADPNTGLPKQLREKDASLRISEVRAVVSPAGIAVEVKGKKIVNDWFDQKFTINVLVKPRVENGKVNLEVIRKSIDTSSSIQDVLGNILLLGIYDIIIHGVEDYALKQIVKNISETSSGIGGGQKLVGIACLEQALLLWL